MPEGGLRRKALPSPCVGMSSPAGRQLFSEALVEGGMRGFFPLVEAFHTQAESTFCGLSTLVNVLNALGVDPGEIGVSGVWRWYNEWMLGCCVSMEEIQAHGVTFDQWARLAECQGLHVDAFRAEDSHVDQFRRAVATTCAQSDCIMCLSYSREVLGQTGDGHYSPVGGYHAASDHALVLDVARFKYPPHWVPLQKLWDAMSAVDEDTGRSRGYALFSRRSQHTGLLCVQLTFGRKRVDALQSFLDERLPVAACECTTAKEELWAVVRAIPPLVASLLKVREPYEATDGFCKELWTSLQRSALHTAVQEAAATLQACVGPPPVPLLDCTALLLVLGDLLQPHLPKVWPVIHASEQEAGGLLQRELCIAKGIISYMLSAAPSCHNGCCKVLGGEFSKASRL